MVKIYKKKRYVKKAKRRSVGKVTTSTMKTMINRAISRTIENKTAQTYNFQKVLYTSTDVSFPDNIIELGPCANMLISQGVGQGSRVGNTITTKKLTFKGTIVPYRWDSVYNNDPRPVQLKMWIFYDKSNPTAVPAPGNDFYQDGSSSRGFSNDLTDLWSPINKDRYRVLATKSFKLGFSQYQGTAGSATNQSYWQQYSNNDFKLNCNFSFDLTKHYPKIVKFNDNNTDPMTRGLFCLFYYVGADGLGLPAGTRALTVQYMQDYSYEDA